jgi:hypothetical protein
VTVCGPAACMAVWAGADANYLHRCTLPAVPPHREHVCDEGVTFTAPASHPLVVADDPLGWLLAGAVTDMLSRQPPKPARNVLG